jgi:hypothetical protein
MGKRGPKPALRRSALGVIPDCPFTEAERPDDYRAWEYLADALHDGGLTDAYQVSDVVALERASVLLARAWKWSREATIALEAGSPYVETRSNGLMPHPAIREERLAWDAVGKVLAQLGLDPRSRSEMVDADPAGDDLDELEQRRQSKVKAG